MLPDMLPSLCYWMQDDLNVKWRDKRVATRM
jgi:hypothetical protein